MDSRSRTPLFGIIALLLSLAGLASVQIMTKTTMGAAYLPSRLVYFIIVADSAAICFFLWQLGRVRKINLKTNGEGADQPLDSFGRNLLKTLVVFAILEACVTGIVSLAFGIPLERMWLPFLLFFIPVLAGLPLILRARQFHDRPKLSAFWAAIGVAILCTLELVASYYSGLWEWVVPGTTNDWELDLAIFFGAAITFASAYYSTYWSLTSKKS